MMKKREPYGLQEVLVIQNRRQLTLTIAEIALIILVALWVNWTFVSAPAHERVNGIELEWLTSSAHFAHVSLRDYGYLPLWQPYNDFGEPLIDNPFSFVLNPLSAAPTLIWGGVVGIRVSVVLYGIFAGIGGYFLARVLRLGLVPRLLLAALMIGKGNMLAMIGEGYFQLGTAQAYFPWIIGAGIVTLRNASHRWAVVLLAVMFTLLFWAGNIWYTLPMLFCLALLTMFHILPRNGQRWDGVALRRMLLAGVFTIGLSAVSLLPILLNSDHIGGHPREVGAGVVTNPLRVATFFFGAEREFFDEKVTPYFPQFYYSYVVPLWFFAFVLLILPPIGRFRIFNRAALPQTWRIWLPGVIALIGTFIWGVGGNPLMIFLYDTFPLLAQWRFVGRALAVASFWLAVLVALRYDSLWRLVFDPQWRNLSLPPASVRAAQVNIGILLLLLGGFAAYQVNFAASIYAYTRERATLDGVCIRWLREQYPNRDLAIWRHGYEVTAPFIDNQVRQIGIEADFAVLPEARTIGQIDLTHPDNSPSEFMLGWFSNEGRFITFRGYQAVVDSPRTDGRSCLYRYANALPYAYTIPYATIETHIGSALDAELTEPVQSYQRLPDRIRLLVSGDPYQSLVVTLQEKAYPGWQVWVDGQSAKLESVGGQVGVLLPPSLIEHEIEFAYRPPLLFSGGALTLATAVACGVYLLIRWRK
jgi:hypothetical protein